MERHLAQRVGFMDRMPEPFDEAEVGWLEGDSGQFHPLVRTTAWNFQQGAMAQWDPRAPSDRILFNRRDGDGFAGAVADLEGRIVCALERPIANVDPSGRFALSVNFSRMFDYRPGYGYAGPPDPFANEAQPEGDGIFRVDLGTGRSEPILSLRELGRICRPWLGDRKILVNHLALNPSGKRFVALIRPFFNSGEKGLRTIVLTAGADGSEPFVLWDGGNASHYHWRDAETLSMVIPYTEGRSTLAEFRDRTKEYRFIDPEFFRADGHQSYSPDRRFMLYDSYPIEQRRHLYLYDLEAGRGCDLGSVASAPWGNSADWQIRCDLHPRWRPDGRAVSLDSIHEGFRGIYVLEPTPDS